LEEIDVLPTLIKLTYTALPLHVILSQMKNTPIHAYTIHVVGKYKLTAKRQTKCM
jgi:hypothetical protein